MPDTSLDFKTGLAVLHPACEVVEEAVDEMDNLLWDLAGAGMVKDYLGGRSQRLFQNLESYVQLSLSFCALLNDVSQGEYLFNASLLFPKTCLLAGL